MRKSDIIFILNVILNCISPGSPRIKSTTEANTSIIGIGGGGGSGATRSGSVTERKVRMSTFQIGFLGMDLRNMTHCPGGSWGGGDKWGALALWDWERYDFAEFLGGNVPLTPCFRRQ